MSWTAASQPGEQARAGKNSEEVVQERNNSSALSLMPNSSMHRMT